MLEEVEHLRAMSIALSVLREAYRRRRGNAKCRSMGGGWRLPPGVDGWQHNHDLQRAEDGLLACDQAIEWFANKASAIMAKHLLIEMVRKHAR